MRRPVRCRARQRLQISSRLVLFFCYLRFDCYSNTRSVLQQQAAAVVTCGTHDALRHGLALLFIANWPALFEF